jgi:hypothetical protein
MISRTKLASLVLLAAVCLSLASLPAQSQTKDIVDTAVSSRNV